MTEQFGFWVACVVLIAVVAGGCTADEYSFDALGTYRVDEKQLKSGTVCVIVNSAEGVAVSCDWEANRVQPIHIELSPGEYDGEEVNEFLKRVEAASIKGAAK